MSTNFETIHLSLSYLCTFIYSMPDPLQLHKGEFAKIVDCRIDRIHTTRREAIRALFAITAFVFASQAVEGGCRT